MAQMFDVGLKMGRKGENKNARNQIKKKEEQKKNNNNNINKK